MVIAGTINRVAFYCRVNHRDRDYEKYLEQKTAQTLGVVDVCFADLFQPPSVL